MMIPNIHGNGIQGGGYVISQTFHTTAQRKPSGL